MQGFSFGGSGQNNGARLREPQGLERAQVARAARATRSPAARWARSAQIKDAFAFAFAPPPMPELGIATGFAFFLKDNAGLGHEALVAARNQFLGAAAQSKLLANVRPNGQEDTPQFRIDVDTEKAAALGLSIADINDTLSAAWGGQLHRRLRRPRPRQARLRAGRRAVPHDAGGLQALVGAQRRGADGAVHRPSPPRAGTTARRASSATTACRRWRSTARPRPASAPATPWPRSSGWSAQLPAGFGIEWTGALVPGARGGRADAAALRAVAADRVPVPRGAVRELERSRPRCCWWRRSASSARCSPTRCAACERDVYFQVAMLTTVGLTSKNAILIIEFAKANLEKRHGPDRRHDAGGARPAAPDPDDLARLRPRRAAARDRDRRRLRRAARDRHRRARRHDRPASRSASSSSRCSSWSSSACSCRGKAHGEAPA